MEVNISLEIQDEDNCSYQYASYREYLMIPFDEDSLGWDGWDKTLEGNFC